MTLEINEGPQSDLTVVTLADENPLYLCGFVAAHVMQGASKVIVYLDRGAGNAFSKLAGKVPELEIVLCDDDFWEGKRPQNVEGRQRLCYSEAYDRAQTGWVALCDADEIFVPATNFQTELARVEPEAQMIACPTWEGIWETDSDYEGLYSPTHARRRVKDTSFRDSFFGNTQLFEILTRDGLVGHVFGKYLLRKAIPKVRKRIHSAFVPDEEGNLVNLSKSKTAQMSLLHFDAISFSAWCLKHQKRVDRETLMTGNRTSRVAQTDIYQMLSVETARIDFFNQLYTLAPEKIPKLTDRGFVRSVNFEDKIAARALSMFEMLSAPET